MANDCPNNDIERRAHTALHVIKGAIVKVLGEQALWTASTYVNGSHGRITVTCKEKPTPKDMKRIEDLANEAIMKDLRVETVILPREEAEKKFGKIIYDLFPVPEHVKELTIVIIRDLDGSIWNINACNKEHTKTTGEIGKIAIRKYRFRRSKGLLEVSFDIE